jgi:hypothetical protein
MYQSLLTGRNSTKAPKGIMILPLPHIHHPTCGTATIPLIHATALSNPSFIY